MLKHFVFCFVFLGILQLSHSKDVQVKGYYRKNGTYVAPHVRSSPDKYKWNNHGSGESGSSPYTRDRDKDGIANQYDTDDDDDGTPDDQE